MLLSKLTAFYSIFLVWVRNHERRPVRPSWGGWLCCARKLCCTNLVVGVDWGGFKWVSLCRCAWYNLGVRSLLRQIQYQTWRPVQLPGLQGTWDPSSAEHPGVRPRKRDCNLAINSTFYLRNELIYFCGHDSTQSGEYNLGLLAHNPINQEDKQRKKSVGSVNAARACPFSIFPTKAKAYPFPLSSKSPRQNLQTWHQQSLLFGSPVVPRLTCCPVFL